MLAIKDNARNTLYLFVKSNLDRRVFKRNFIKSNSVYLEEVSVKL